MDVNEKKKYVSENDNNNKYFQNVSLLPRYTIVIVATRTQTLSWKIPSCSAAFFLVQDVRVSRCKTFLFAKLDFIIEKLMFFSQTSSFRSICI